MVRILQKIEESELDRRKFLQIAAATGVVASIGLTGCENKVTETTSESPTTETLSGGEWKTFTCSNGGCSRACVNQAYVVDGVILRQRTDETIPDSVDNPQKRSCIKGRGARWDITAPDRLKYPMKRKSWQPGGGENINGHLRGVDEWERISWDDAIRYIADEFTRIRDTYGNRSLLATCQEERKMGGQKLGSAIFNLLGGCLTLYGQQSQGGGPVPGKFLYGQWSNGGTDAMDRMAMRHSKLIVYWGNNSAWSQGSSEVYNMLNAKKAGGAKVICIDPWYNPTYQAVCDQWIPIRPSTDGALIEALCYELIQNNLVEQDFLDRCVVGYDADHMPDNAQTDENFKDYILGAYDGQARTPEWASPITGVPVDVIRQLAQDMGTIKPMSLRSCIAVVRSYYGNRYTQLLYALGWMTGSVGVLGADTSVMQGAYGDKNGTQLVDQGSSNYKYPHNPICTEPRADGELTGGKYDPSHEYGIAFAEWPRAVVTGEYTIPGPANDKRACDIKCVYCESGRNSSNNHSGNQYIVEAYRKLDFVVHQELYMKAGPIYSDIVLPVTSLLEMDFAYAFRTQSELCIVGTQVVPQYYECKDDVEIVFMLRDALGFGEDDLPYYTCRQAMFDMLANTTVAMDDGENREPLVSITSDDLSTHGFEGEPQEGRVPFSEFIQNGIYEFMRKPDDNHMNVWLEDFRKDPEANPVKTATGKLELYSQALVDYYKACQFHDIDAIPKYKPMVDGYEQIPQDPDYKYQMVTPHHNRQVHSTNSSNKQLNEVFPNDLKMNVFDAQRDGFKAGDWVLVSGRNAGKIVRRIKVVPYVAPGTILLGEGNWVDIDHDTGIDMGGNVNILTRPQLLGDGYQAYNTVLLKIEPYTGTQLLPDYRRPYKVPLAE